MANTCMHQPKLRLQMANVFSGRRPTTYYSWFILEFTYHSARKSSREVVSRSSRNKFTVSSLFPQLTPTKTTLSTSKIIIIIKIIIFLNNDQLDKGAVKIDNAMVSFKLFHHLP
jgi:hypothetical protein